MILRPCRRLSILTILLLSLGIPGNTQSTTLADASTVNDADPSPVSSFGSGIESASASATDSASSLPSDIGVPPNPNDTRFCYWEDGGIVHKSINMKPCPSRDSSKHSMCCRLTRTGITGNEPELCRLDGLCQLPRANPINSQSFMRGGCTDPTFQAPECLKVCRLWDQRAGRIGQPVKVCDNGSFCCGNAGNLETDTCCRENRGFNIDFDQSLGYPVVTNVSDSTAFVSSSIAPTTSADPSSAPVKDDSGSSLSTGAILGIVATNITLVAIVIGVVWYLRRRKMIGKKEKSQYSQFHNSESALFNGQSSHHDIVGSGYGLKAELDASPRPEDMAPRAPVISELGAESPVSRPGTAGGIASPRVHEMPGTEVRAGEIFELDGSTPTREDRSENEPPAEQLRRRNTGSSSAASTHSNPTPGTPRIVVTSP